MKTAFKVMNILMIIYAAFGIITEPIIFLYMESFYASVVDVGLAKSLDASYGLVSFLHLIFIITIAILALYAGINGLRGRMEKCRKFAFWLLIDQAVGTILLIVRHFIFIFNFFLLLFFGAYYFIAKKYINSDNNTY